MEITVSIVGTMAALASAFIALAAYTRESRLHRRIARLQTVLDLMQPSPSPVLERSLRGSLAELQSREALRGQQQSARLQSTLAVLLTALIVAALAISLLSHVSSSPITAKPVTSAVLACISGAFAFATATVLASKYSLEFMRKDLQRAFFLKVRPLEEGLQLRPLYRLSDRDVRRSLTAGLLTTTGTCTAGFALGFTAFAITDPEYIGFFSAVAGTLVSISLSLFIQGHIPRTRGKDTRLTVWPTQKDFGIQH